MKLLSEQHNLFAPMFMLNPPPFGGYRDMFTALPKLGSPTGSHSSASPTKELDRKSADEEIVSKVNFISNSLREKSSRSAYKKSYNIFN